MPTGKTIAEAISKGNPAEVASAMQMLGGAPLCYVEEDVSQSAAATATIDSPLLAILGVDVTAVGTAATGERMIGHSGSTASATLVKVEQLTTGGKLRFKLTFEGTVTAFTYTALRFAAQPPAAMFANLADATSGTDLLDLPVER